MATTEPDLTVNPVDVDISDESDLELRVFDFEFSDYISDVRLEFPWGTETSTKATRRRIFHVKESFVESPVLKAKKRWRDINGDASEEETQVDDVDALEILIRDFHKTHDKRFLAVKTHTIWQLYNTAHYYGIPIGHHAPPGDILKDWFAEWYSTNNVSQVLREKPPRVDINYAPQLYFPASWFDEPHAFAELTKRLMYHGRGHLKEELPRGIKVSKGSLDNQINSCLNGAKGRLRNVLQHGLYDACQDLVVQNASPCCQNAFLKFHLGLKNCKIWPMEVRIKAQSIDELILQLQGFKFPDPDASAKCYKCDKNYEGIVKRVCIQVEQYIDGLCLDCLRDSRKEIDSSTELDYWERRELYEVEGGKTCRIEHGNPTWYWSYAGPEARRAKIMPPKRRVP